MSIIKENTDAMRKDGRFSYNATIRLDRVALDESGHPEDLEASVEDYQGYETFAKLQEHIKNQLEGLGWS